jgi:hypothetical protein
MTFYNRNLAQQVQKFTDLFGKVQPLDVVQYGGASKVSAAVNNSTVTLLGAPPAGFVYRVHRFTTTTLATANLLGLSSGAPYGYALAPPGAAVDNCFGQLAPEGLRAFSAVATTCWLFYDLVVTPNIS